MPHMPKHLGVGPIFGKMEERYRDPAAAKETLNRLRNKQGNNWRYTLAEIGSIAATGTVTNHQAPGTPKPTMDTTALTAHLNNHWFGTSDPASKATTGWWNLWKGESEATLREALTRALEKALFLQHDEATSQSAAHRPVQIFWICGLPRFETYVSWAPEMVTLVILTPGWYQGIDWDFSADTDAALEVYMGSNLNNGMLFVGQNVGATGTVITMASGVVVHRMDITRDGRGA